MLSEAELRTLILKEAEKHLGTLKEAVSRLEALTEKWEQDIKERLDSEENKD